MSHEIIKIDGNVITVHIRGAMLLSDQKALQNVARDFIERGVQPKVLVLTEDFDGWEKSEHWAEDDLLLEQGDEIAKIAIVGEQRWEESMLMFVGAGLRSTEIKFFDPSLAAEAEQWLRG
ncbi:MAG: STAS/SEC14 domain-containing protein [Methylobacter sp.]|nr:STAS/SEC14 domain-containing protein [Methylobacter sp.]